MSARDSAIATPLDPASYDSGPWLVSLRWDGLWMFCGLWLLVPLIAADLLGLEAAIARRLLLLGLLFLWGGHIIAPIVYAWKQPTLRADLKTQKGRYIVLPIGLFLFSIIVGAYTVDGAANAMPYLMMNYRFTGYGAALFLFFTFWNVWHFSSQHFGVLSIYRVRSQQFAPDDRKWDRAFTLAITCGLLPIAWYSQGRRLGVLLDVLPQADRHGTLAIAVASISALLTAIMMMREYRKANRSIPKIIYILSIGIQPVFGVVAYSLYHFAIFSMAHWIVAIAILARISSNASATAARETGHCVGFTHHFYWHAGIVFLASIPMYVLLESSAVPVLIGSLTDITDGSPLQTTIAHRSVGMVAGAALGIAFAHFIYDRYIYSFSKPLIQKTIVPHLF